MRRFSSAIIDSISNFTINKLPNGIKVASINVPGPLSTAGILFKTNAESDYKSSLSSYIIEKLAFKATKNLSASQLQSRLDRLIGQAVIKTSREYLVYSGAIIPKQLEELINLLSEIIVNPLITQECLKETEVTLEYQKQELFNKTDDLMPNMIHGPSFYYRKEAEGSWSMDRNSILGYRIKDVTNLEELFKEHQRKLVSDNMIILAVGQVDPKDLQNISAKSPLSSLPFSSSFCSSSSSSSLSMKGKDNSPINTFNDDDHVTITRKSISAFNSDSTLSFTGGHNYIENGDLPLVHVSIAFESTFATHPDSIIFSLIQMLMGGGGSFSAGGPGKGMYSRLYTQVLNRYHWIECARSFNHIYGKSGIFGIHGSALPNYANDLVQVLLSQLESMADDTNPMELERAKNQLKSSLTMELESRVSQLEDLADCMYYFGRQRNMKRMIDEIDSITREDVSRVVETMLNRKKIAVAAYGPLRRLPSFDKIVKCIS